jgi:hypothetical protein
MTSCRCPACATCRSCRRAPTRCSNGSTSWAPCTTMTGAAGGGARGAWRARGRPRGGPQGPWAARAPACCWGRPRRLTRAAAPSRTRVALNVISYGHGEGGASVAAEAAVGPEAEAAEAVAAGAGRRRVQGWEGGGRRSSHDDTPAHPRSHRSPAAALPAPQPSPRTRARRQRRRRASTCCAASTGCTWSCRRCRGSRRAAGASWCRSRRSRCARACGTPSISTPRGCGSVAASGDGRGRRWQGLEVGSAGCPRRWGVCRSVQGSSSSLCLHR